MSDRVCDGCNVREPFEHRCTGVLCPCTECREADRMFPSTAPPTTGEGDRPEFTRFRDRLLESPGVRAAYEEAKERRDTGEGDREALTEAERRVIRSMGDYEGVFAAVERILADRRAGAGA